ncbi:MAG TPA: oligosaccharide flippase family protein [Verrucomicrobiae bacterium]|nr:oligosaccharide flippase family protein [Verrucomicrobiae bacterium]
MPTPNMLSAKACLDAFCPPFLQRLKARIEASPLAYRLARGAFWSLAGSLISRGMGLLAGVLVARLLGKHDYGQLGMVQSTTGMFGIFAGFGMGLTANKHVAEFKNKDQARAGRIICLSSLVSWTTGGLLTLVLLTFAPWLARNTLGSPQMTGLLQAGAWLLLLGGVNGAQTGALAGFEAFKTIARINLIAGLLAFPITLAGVWFGGVTGSVWALVVNLALNCVMNFVALRKEAARAGVPLSYRHCTQEWPVLWSFSVPAVLGGAIAAPVTWAASAWLVNQADGYAQMGIFNAIYRIRIIPEMMLNMLLAPLLPVLSETFGLGNMQGYRKAVRSALAISLMVTVPFALLQIAVPSLTLLPYGHAYAGHAAVVQWSMFDLAVMGLFNPLMNQIIVSMNRMWLGFAYSAGFSIIYGALAYVFVLRYGAAGLAAAGILAHVICLGPYLFYIYRSRMMCASGLPMNQLSLALCAAAALAYAASRSSNQPLAGGLAVVLISAFVYFQAKILLR